MILRIEWIAGAPLLREIHDSAEQASFDVAIYDEPEDGRAVFAHIPKLAILRRGPQRSRGSRVGHDDALFFPPISSTISLKLAGKCTKVEDVIGTRSGTAA